MNSIFTSFYRAKFAVFVSLFLAALIAGCSATKLTSSYVINDHPEPKQYKQLGVVFMSPSDPNRALIEVAVAEKFRTKDIKAFATFDIFPYAGKMEKVRKGNETEEEIRKHIKERVEENEIDGLLVIVLFDQQQEERYVSTYPNYYAPGIYAPTYGYSYYDYYAYAANTIYQPGYYVNSSTFFLESNLYDVETEELLWSGHTKTRDPGNVDYEASNFANIIITEMIRKKIIKP